MASNHIVNELRVRFNQEIAKNGKSRSGLDKLKAIKEEIEDLEQQIHEYAEFSAELIESLSEGLNDGKELNEQAAKMRVAIIDKYEAITNKFYGGLQE